MDEQEFWRQVRSAHPRLWEALVADAEIALRMRAEGGRLQSRTQALREIIRLACVSDGFLGQALYRAKARMQALGVPVLPRIAHRLAMIVAQVAIGDPVVIAPGVYIAHGQVVIDGITEIAAGVVIAPFVSIGLKEGSMKGPTIEQGAHIGTGSRLLGPLHIGERANIGANAVVTHDVPAGATVVGIPARPR